MSDTSAEPPSQNDDDPEVPNATVRATLAKWKLSLRDNINYRLDMMFPQLTGWGAKGKIKQKVALIRLLEPLLAALLRDGEEVRYIARGVRQSFAQSMFMGAMWANLINQRAFVLTNARLIVLTINSRGKPKQPLWMIYYSEIAKFQGTLLGNLQLKLNDRTNLVFAGFSKLDRQHMPQVFQAAIDDYQRRGFEPTTTQSLEWLCTKCYARVPKGEFICEECGAEFWKPADVAARSLLAPSWGDFALGHTALAIFELLGFLIGWGFFAIVLVSQLQAPAGPDWTFVAIHLAGMISAHAIDAALTYHMASSGLHFRRMSDDNSPGADQSDA